MDFNDDSSKTEEYDEFSESSIYFAYFLRTVILCKLLERELESWGGVIHSQYFNRKGEPSIRMNEHGFPRIACRKMT